MVLVGHCVIDIIKPSTSEWSLHVHCCALICTCASCTVGSVCLVHTKCGFICVPFAVIYKCAAALPCPFWNILGFALHCWFESVCKSICYSVQWHKEMNFAVTCQVTGEWVKGLGSFKWSEHRMFQSAKGLGCKVASLLCLLCLKEGSLPQGARIPK